MEVDGDAPAIARPECSERSVLSSPRVRLEGQPDGRAANAGRGSFQWSNRSAALARAVEAGIGPRRIRGGESSSIHSPPASQDGGTQRPLPMPGIAAWPSRKRMTRFTGLPQLPGRGFTTKVSQVERS